MLEILFAIGMLLVFGRLFFFGIRVSWGIMRILFTIVFFPVILVGMVLGGLLYLAIPILLIVGIITFVIAKV